MLNLRCGKIRLLLTARRWPGKIVDDDDDDRVCVCVCDCMYGALRVCERVCFWLAESGALPVCVTAYAPGRVT